MRPNGRSAAPESELTVNIARTARHARLRRIIPALAVVIAALVVSALVVSASQIASAQTTTRAVPGSGPKPAIVLEHGAWANTASWNAVIQRLQADGYTVYAPPNPLQGLTYDSAYLADFLHSISGPIVLVGHSYGGDVITNAATGDTQVKALVYVDAFAPAQGQTLAQLLAAYPGSCAEPSNLTVVPFPGAPAGTGDAYITQSAFPSCMANGLPAREARALAADQAPLATIALTQPSGVPAWKTIPSWAVVGTADHAIPPALQLAMAENAHARITEVNAPHLAMISDPGVVTSVILQAVRATT
jgi:pimeloyl-ACP methyl ester carboxylesterase